MEKNVTTDKLKELRKSKTSGSGAEFKKVFKGYDCKEVDEYIISIKNNLELTEKAFNDRLEEAFSTSSVYLQERDKLNQKLQESEKLAEQVKSEARILIERERVASSSIKKENDTLQAAIDSLQNKIDEYEQERVAAQQNESMIQKNTDLETEIGELKNKYNDLISTNEVITQKNMELISQINDLNESIDTIRQEADHRVLQLNSEIADISRVKDTLTVENNDLKAAANKVSSNFEKICSENEELKKTVNASLVSRRYQAMSTNMKIFEYMKNHELNIENISSNLNEVLKSVDLMKQETLELFEKTKIDIDQQLPLEKTV